jgi:hypothetical protein
VNSNSNPQTTGRPKHRLRRIVLKLAIVAVTSVVCLLLAEFATRILFPQFNPSAQLAFQVMPGNFALGPPLRTERDMTPKGDFNVEVKFNQYGFRDVKDFHDATSNDWFAVGDSFTLGFGVDEDKRFSNLLEQKIQAAGGHERIYSIAIPGNFLDYQRLVKYAESRGAKVNHLIVGVCMDNDLENYTTGKSDWELLPQWNANGSLMSRIRKWLKARSALYITTSFVLESSPASRHLMEKIGLANDLVALDVGHKSSLDEIILKTSRDELVKLVAGRDAIILLIPSRRLWLGGDEKTESQIHTTFAQMCRDAGLNVVDLKPVFEQDPNPLSFYFTHDPHWSPRGHEVAAAELLKAVEAHKQN